MDALRAMQDALNLMQYAHTLKQLNEELYEHLHGSIRYIIGYTEKNHIALPQKDALLELLVKTDNYANMIREKKIPHTQWDRSDDS
jgi:hypothetical protein